VVAIDFFAYGRHQVIDAVITTVYKNTVLQQVAEVPGYVARQVEDMKFYADMTSSQPIASVHGGQHVLIPFAMEDGGRQGAHAETLLRDLATFVLAKGRTNLATRKMTDAPHSMLISLWIRLWQQRLPAWLHVALSRHVTRLLCHATVARLRYM
jgi:hypothetical protein